MARISACIVARDEERLLPGCLASLAGAVDELVVVDTGSRDRTRELARGAGARVHDLPWRGDFAAARNEALDRATGEFVLQIDADERLAPGSGAVLRALAASGELELAVLLLHDADRLDAAAEDVLSGRARLGHPMRLGRFFRRAPWVRYRGLVHESIDDSVAGRPWRARLADAHLVHLGNVPALRAALGKDARNLELLRARCAAEPDDVTAPGYLSLELAQAGRMEEALALADRAWPLVAAQPGHRSVQRLALARAYAAVRLGRPGLALETLDAAEARMGRRADFELLRGTALDLLAAAAPSARERAEAARRADDAFRRALEPAPAEEVLIHEVGSAGHRARVARAAAPVARAPAAASATPAGRVAAAAPRVALCLIARDEEAMLPACLASVAGAVDEVVVVDTGSADRTRELARAAGARVVEHRWGGDFAAARNEALRHARADFVLVLDADERLAPGGAAAVREAVRGAAWDCGMVSLHNASRLDAAPADVVLGRARDGAPQLLPRLLRNAGGLAWTGIVHESVDRWLAARGGRCAALPVHLAHYGHVAALRAARGKRARNLELLRRRCAEEPDDVLAFGYLAGELLEDGLDAEARAVAEAGWRLLPSQRPERSVHRLAAVRALLALRAGDPGRALDSAAAAEARQGPHPDWHYLRGCALEQEAIAAGRGTSRRAELASAAARAFAAAAACRGTTYAEAFAGGAAGIASVLRQGHALLVAGRPGDALAAFDAVLAEAPDARPAAWGRAEALLALGQAEAALGAVAAHLDAAPDGWLLAALAARALGAAADGELFGRRARERTAQPFAARHRAERLDELPRAA